MYNIHKGDPLSTPASPRPTSVEQVLGLATPERFALYQQSGKSSSEFGPAMSGYVLNMASREMWYAMTGGASESMIDHYYDKLLSVARPPPALVQNSFL
eukprot:SAG31_NODE_8659_length_1411_cov_2.022104_1_plen_98_part_10